MKIFKNLKYTIKYHWQSLFWLNVLFSPFVRLSCFFYFGKIAHANPYFYPRVWRKFTYQDCIEAAEKAKSNKRLIPITHKPEYYKNYRKAIPAKWFHFKITHLGWKTKWDSYRFEWSPSISLVILNRQLFIAFVPSIKDNSMLNSFWEAFLVYHYETDRRLSTKARLFRLFKQYSCTWVGGTKAQGNETRTDYYYSILKPKYIKYYEEIKGLVVIPREQGEQ